MNKCKKDISSIISVFFVITCYPITKTVLKLLIKNNKVKRPLFFKQNYRKKHAKSLSTC